MIRLFGTDGIRGRFGLPPLDSFTVDNIGRCLVGLLQRNGDRPTILIAGDTRASTPRLAAWLAHGVRRAGGRVRYAGTLPTPAVAYLTRAHGAAAGVAVSASHNPAPDNGLKFFDAEGFKWSRAREERLEGSVAACPREVRVDGPLWSPDEEPPPPVEAALARHYLDHLTATLPEDTSLSGLRLVVDAAHGAASGLAGHLFAGLGAEVTLLHADPDGTNINRDCGSTHPEVIQQAVREHGADLGLTLDGDADRALFADAAGELRDGDAVLYLWARELLEAGELDPPRVVATVMSNLGLEVALRELGVELLRADVGDREVVEMMRRGRLILGGEQSGHTVHLGLSTTGDGLLTALHVAAALARHGGSLAALLEGFEAFPQLLLNVPVEERVPFERIPGLTEIVAGVEGELGDRGRLLLRYSGTEPVARIMLEGPDRATLETLAERVAEPLRRR